MAGNAFAVIDVIDLSDVRGGFDRAAVVQRALVQAGGFAMSGPVDTDRVVRTKDDGGAKAMLSLFSRRPHRRSGSGPAGGPVPAPALPPTSTLTAFGPMPAPALPPSTTLMR